MLDVALGLGGIVAERVLCVHGSHALVFGESNEDLLQQAHGARPPRLVCIYDQVLFYVYINEQLDTSQFSPGNDQHLTL